ncbi:hypothetical protein Tco_0789219, partial [Tanacetum coccineum]
NDYNNTSKFISEVVKVVIHGEEYDVYIHELGSWSTNLDHLSLKNSDSDSKVDSESKNKEDSENEGDLHDLFHEEQVETTKNDKHDIYKNSLAYMAPLPYHNLRHPWLRYQVDGYDEGITLGDRLSMVYTGDDGQALFTSHAWRRLFEVKGPLVREFILEFLNTCRISDTKMGLDVADTLCFQLGGARRRMTWRQFILALGLHTEEEMAEAGFGAYWSGSERVIPDKGDLRDYWMEISSDRDFLGPAPLMHLRRHAEGRKSGARLSGGHFIGRLAAHFGLVNDQGLRGLSVVASELPLIDLHELGRLNICSRFGDTWAWVAPGPERQQAAAAGAPGAAEDAPAADEGAQAVPAPVQAPQPPPPAPQHWTMT